MSGDRTANERGRRYRKGIKVEDETRGNAAINPVRYKKDIPVQVWMESRYLATLSEWLDKSERTRRLSEVVQKGIEILVDHLVMSDQIKMVDDSVAARDMLVYKYGIKIRDTYGARGRNNRIHNAVLTERRRELGERIDYNVASGADYKKKVLEEEWGMPFEEALRKGEELRKRRMEEEEREKVVIPSDPNLETVIHRPTKHDGVVIETSDSNNNNVDEVVQSDTADDVEGGVSSAPAKEHVIDVEESQRRAKAVDKALEEM